MDKYVPDFFQNKLMTPSDILDSSLLLCFQKKKGSDKLIMCIMCISMIVQA